jgi:hypothetical protein
VLVCIPARCGSFAALACDENGIPFAQSHKSGEKWFFYFCDDGLVRSTCFVAGPALVSTDIAAACVPQARGVSADRR